MNTIVQSTKHKLIAKPHGSQSRWKGTTPILIRIIFGLLVIACGMLMSGNAQGADALFPSYASILPNIEFWKAVYSQYPSSQGILHDNRDLSLIYGIIKLKPYDVVGARKINRDRMKKAKQKYRSILLELARGKSPKNAESIRVAKLFGPKANKASFRQAAGRIRCQVGQKDRFRKGLIRSGAYLKRIQEILRKDNLPEDLSYLPHVESSFNPNAYSKFGAAGIWQFTRSTGRRYMKFDYVVDERRDPILSTFAAARLLRNNYNRLGSWPLALTAYNHGANGMARAKRLNGGYEAIYNKGLD